MPTPEFAPRTSTVWPGRIAARPVSMCHAVRNTSGTLAASLKSSESGIGMTFTGRDGDQFAVAAIDGIAEHGKLAALVLQSSNTFHAVIAEMHGRKQNALAGL